MLGFDDYADIGDRLRAVLAGRRPRPHVPPDRRLLLPITPVDRPAVAVGTSLPGHGDLPAGVRPASGPRVLRRRLDGGPAAPLKLASGCDRRCTFCAIPSFRGSFVSRRPAEIARRGALAGRPGRPRARAGQRELHVLRQGPRRPPAAREPCCRSWPRSTASSGSGSPTCSRPRPGRRCSRRSPAPRAWRRTSTCPSSTPAPSVLRRMRRFGSTESFLELLERGPGDRAGGRARGPTSSSASPARPRTTSPSSSGS